MKTKLERQALVHDYLELLWDGYRSGDFSEVFSHLATDCEMHSQWVFQPNVGYDAIVDYFTEKGNTLKETKSFPKCSIQELLGSARPVCTAQIYVDGVVESGKVELWYEAGELCLLMEQQLEDKTVSAILRLTLNDDGKIDTIHLCAPELFSYREWNDGTFMTLYPARGEEEKKDCRIRISDRYYGELSIALSSIGREFDEWGEESIPMNEWERVLQKWQELYSFESFDALLESVGGVDYNTFCVEHPKALATLMWNGKRMWDNRLQTPNIVRDLMEWTQRHKACCDTVNIFGF